MNYTWLTFKKINGHDEQFIHAAMEMNTIEMRGFIIDDDILFLNKKCLHTNGNITRHPSLDYVLICNWYIPLSALSELRSRFTDINRVFFYDFEEKECPPQSKG